MKVSIIMPVYNGEEFLKTSIESVSRQSLKDIELICIDDGSEDDSLSVLKSLGEKYSFIKILTQENQGSGKARNYGMDEAKGEYIGFIDADDEFVDTDSLELLYETAVKNDADIVSGNLMKLTTSRKLVANPNCPDDNYYCFSKDCVISPEEYGVPWAFYKNIFKRKFLDDNGLRFRDLIRGQDPVFMAETLAYTDRVYGVKTDFYAYMFPAPGKPYAKVNSTKKKRHYITHYKNTFDVYENAGMYKASEKYKPKFINYLNYSVRANDLEIYELVTDIFGENNNYFKNFQHEYDAFKAHHMVNKIGFEDSEEFYNSTKEKLMEMNLAANPLLSDELNSRLVTLLSSDDFDEYKDNMSVKNIEYYSMENEKLEKAITREEKLLSDLSSSSSWRITKPLRTIRNTFRK